MRHAADARRPGWRATGRRSTSGAWSVVYVNDHQGFSVELLHVEPWYEGQMGFRQRPTPRLAPFAGGTPARRLRPSSRFGKAIITGAAGGIGTELARLAAEDGTSLVLMDRGGAGLSELAAELGRSGGGRHRRGRLHRPRGGRRRDRLPGRGPSGHRPADCRRGPRSRAVPPGVRLAPGRGRLQGQRASRTWYCSPTSCRRWPSAGRGHVTTIVSLRGPGRAPYEAAYSGSKAALATIADSARAELEPRGITFTAVFPGFVDTPMFRANAFKHTYSLTPAMPPSGSTSQRSSVKSASASR